jgi:hypothetical protein
MQILLGQGLFYISNVAVGLTRGGGKFTVEREIRNVEADGDYGVVKDRNYITKQVPKLELSQMENIISQFGNSMPGITTSALTTYNSTAFTGTLITALNTIVTGDYKDVEFRGQTIEGKKVIIKLKNAINLENIEWELKDKEEVISKVTYTATYTEGSTTVPFEVAYQS